MTTPTKFHQTRKIQHYIEDLFAKENESLKQAKKTMFADGLPDISITPMIGKILYLLASIHGAKRILEIGTLGGYSALWLASALPESGTLLSIEINPKHVATARKNIHSSEHSKKITLIESPAQEVLKNLLEEETEPFDLIFLDADKQSYPGYLEPMIELTRLNGLIITDNLIRRGKVINPNPNDPQATALAQYNQLLAKDPRLESVILPTLVGYAGGDLDGLGLARKIQMHASYKSV